MGFVPLNVKLNPAHAYFFSLTLFYLFEIFKRVCPANRRHEVNENVGTPSQVLPTASKQNSEKNVWLWRHGRQN